jgi:hypothetical protein
MKRWLVVSLAACVVIVGTAAGSVRMGDTEVRFMASLLNENAGDSGGVDFKSWAIAGDLGYFVTDNIQVSIVGTFSKTKEEWTKPADASSLETLKRDTEIYAFGGQIRYHFVPDSLLVPYVGAQALWAHVKVSEDYKYSGPGAELVNWDWERSEDGMLWGPLAGLRFEVAEQDDLFVEYQYHLWVGGIDDLLDDGHAVYLGLIHRFE